MINFYILLLMILMHSGSDIKIFIYMNNKPLFTYFLFQPLHTLRYWDAFTKLRVKFYHWKKIHIKLYSRWILNSNANNVFNANNFCQWKWLFPLLYQLPAITLLPLAITSSFPKLSLPMRSFLNILCLTKHEHYFRMISQAKISLNITFLVTWRDDPIDRGKNGNFDFHFKF